MTDYTNLRKIVTGDIIVKCRFGNDIRRIPINGVPTYDELCLMMYRVFKQDIKSSEDITLKYQDEEGDMISLLDDIDITHAISISNLLKVTIYNKGQPKKQKQDAFDVSSLIDIKDRLEQLIQSLSVSEDTKTPVHKEEQVKKIHRLTPAELASFLTNDAETKEKSSVKELTSLSPKAPSTGTIPYYPPPSNSTSTSVNGSSSTMTTPNVASANQTQAAVQQPKPQQPQQPQQNQVQSQIQNPLQVQQPQVQQPQVQQSQQQQPPLQQQTHHSYIQAPTNVGQVPGSRAHQIRPPQALQSFGQTNQQYINVPHYPAPIKHQPQQPQQSQQPQQPQQPQQLQQSQQQQQQQQQQQNQQQQPPQQRQGYYVPPPPASINTPQLPPQPFHPPQHW